MDLPESPQPISAEAQIKVWVLNTHPRSLVTMLRNALPGAPRLAQPGADSSDKSPLDLFLPSLVPTLANTLIGSYFAWGQGRGGPS